MPRVLLLSCKAVAFAAAPQSTAPAAPARDAVDPLRIRALGVDAFPAGPRTAAGADALVATAVRANLNTLFVQVRRRGAALYTKHPGRRPCPPAA